MNRKSPCIVLALVSALVLLSSAFVLGQNAVSTGSISGTITDPSGAVVEGARITITNVATSQTMDLTSNSTGGFNAGELVPGAYQVQIAKKGFSTVTLTVTVQAGNKATAGAKLQVGEDVQVNLEQATVQGDLTARQIEELPINGRNFLDLAQLEPGVQIQDGQNLGATKAGYSAVSFGGRFGGNTLIEVDGVDVSDETVGTTTTNIPVSAIKEFQVSQSSLDLTTGLTSSGAVNVITKTGSDALHGEAFGAFRDSSFSSQLPGGPGPFQRSQFGGNVGGAAIKDKLFFFLDGERTLQHTAVPALVSYPFQPYSGSFKDPFHEGNVLGQLDYVLSKTTRAFYRFSYFKNDLGATSGRGYSLYESTNTASNDVLGAEFNAVGITHSIRFSYLKFQNQLADATTGNAALPFDNLGAEIFMGSTGLTAGPSFMAPQSTAQRDLELKYDGSKLMGAHFVRFGAAFNRLVAGGFAPLYNSGPGILSNVSSTEIFNAESGPFPGGAANPFNYPADMVTVANGIGYSTAKSGLGFPAGELGPDNRIFLYLGDTWKAGRNFSLTYGLRYDRDTGRTDSQFPGIPQLNTLSPGLGDSVRQPSLNLAPQAGFAWDPNGDGKTVVRGGVGLFWENSLWNNLLADAPLRAQTGTFRQSLSPCAAPGQPVTLQTAAGPINTPGSASALGVCGTSVGYPLIGNALPAVIALQQQWMAASPYSLTATNPTYAGQYLTDCAAGTNCYFAPGSSMLDPNYRSPRSIQMNLGFQREINKGTVLSVDFLRNVQTHYLLGVDKNHTGDTRYFNLIGAHDAINAALASCGAASISLSWSVPCPSGRYTEVNSQGVTVNRPLNIGDYAALGLGSSSDMGGNSCFAVLGYYCAFGGINQNAPPLNFLSPVGRSLYDGLQIKLVETVKNPFQGATSMHFQLAYAISRFNDSGAGVAPDSPVTASSSDQDSAGTTLDNANVNHYFGTSALDRRHQISFGGVVNLRGRFQWAMIGHFDSPLSATLTVPNSSSAGQIFQTDFTGDGTTQDPVPGTKVGNFDRGISAHDLGTIISRYNTTVAGQSTPAGNVLLGANLGVQASDLVGLGAVAPILSPTPLDQQDYSWLRSFDTSLAWTYTYKDRVTFKPSVRVYNVFNFANFDLPSNMMSGLLNGSVGSLNGTTYATHWVNRVGVGTGEFNLGAPRQIEFGLKISF
jgi:hypothetical protein